MDRQLQQQRQIVRFLENFKKIGRNNYTPAMVRSRIRSLKELWLSFNDGHVMLEKITPESTRANVVYFSTNVYDVTEDAYNASLDHMAEVLEELEPPPSPNRSVEMSYSRSSPCSRSISQLPTIQLPPFDGSVVDWESFRDRFSAIIIDNKDLHDFSRMHYLVSFLRGRALDCISGLAITADNFSVAWQSLKERYDNKRRLLSVHLSNLINLPRLSRESVTELQSLRSRAKLTIASLNNLQRNPAELWNDFLVHILAQSLDPITMRAWTLHYPRNTEPLSFDTLDSFLAERIRSLEDISRNDPARPMIRSSMTSRVHTTSAASSINSGCPICNKNHFFSSCPNFVRGSPIQRRDLVKKHRRCFNCLSKNHSSYECPSKFSCRTCQKRHHSLLHAVSDSVANQTKEESQPNLSATGGSTEPEVHSLLAATNTVRRVPVLLATARVTVSSSSGRSAVVRALLDQGSELTLVSENLAQMLRARRVRMPIAISAVGCVSAGTVRHAVALSIAPLSSLRPSFNASALVLPTLTSYRPRNTLDYSDLDHLAGLSWADPNPLSGDPIDLIIGADLYPELMREGVIKGPAGQPVAQNTALGWIISGPVGNREPSNLSSRRRIKLEASINCASESPCLDSPALDEAMKRFWETESIPVTSTLSPAEERCEGHFAATHSRTPDGRYRVRLPFKRNPPVDIGQSRSYAERSLSNLARRLHSHPEQRQAYSEFLRDYEALGHMRRAVNATASQNPVVFMPHHPVFRSHGSSTSVRVVFNASSQTSNGTSLNDHLLTGPKLQTDLLTVLLKWRLHPFVYCADIAKMYRQILVDERDVDFQRILWSVSSSSPPSEFQLLTVTYGMVCAPFLALRVLQQLSLDEGHNFPLATPILKENIYVDDVLFGGDTIAELMTTRDQLVALLRGGGFELKKWSSNSPALLADIPEDSRAGACHKTITSDDLLRILGVTWMPSTDSFSFTVSLPKTTPHTKRSILSTIAKLYDPLGWVTPVTIAAKVLIQRLWHARVSWDDIIPRELYNEWHKIYKGLSSLDGMYVPRWIGLTSESQQIEIHGFADASNVAYAAVVYCKVTSKSNQVTISLLAGKSKVAPLQPLSIPRLELSAAVILARLMKYVISSLSLNDVPCYCWSDSTVTLTWLSQHPSKWKVFVANRVADIQSRVPTAQWRYVPTSDNPADCASRGLLGHELKPHTLWWRGPAWLTQPEPYWPKSIAIRNAEASVEEKSVALHIGRHDPDWDLLSRFSSWPKLLRVTAYLFKFISACRRCKPAVHDTIKRGLALTSDECTRARIFILRLLQRILFANDIPCLKNNKVLPAKSPILPLSPFLDADGILRVGGRISNSPLSFSRRHPILLASHRLTEAIVDHAHLRALHAGIQLTLSVVRRDFWIIRARSIIRNRIHRCVVCVRERAATRTQLMSNLPRNRVTAPTRSFLHSGLDYAGPIQVRASSGRGKTSRKAYIALFICLATRAIHLELVADYTSQAFLNAFSRFSARRGLPQTVYSDNGTNFVGAARELAASFRAAILDPNFQNRTATDGIRWKFSPPSAPHFGGIWEAGVKSVKHHIRRVLKNHTLTFEEMTTLLCRVEACLNSRPIAPLSDSIEEYDSLTPGHFLIGSAILTHPEPSVLNQKENRLTRWQLVRQMTERFWHLWYNDYINALQQRSKWRTIQPALQIGQLVVIKNSNLPPCKWELGRITRCHPGADGLIRVVSIRTASSEVTRPIVKICVLPVNCERGESTTSSTPSN